MLDAHQDSDTALHSYRNWQCCWKFSILNLGQNYPKQRNTSQYWEGICSFSTPLSGILVIIRMHQPQSFHTLGEKVISKYWQTSSSLFLRGRLTQFWKCQLPVLEKNQQWWTQWKCQDHQIEGKDKHLWTEFVSSIKLLQMKNTKTLRKWSWVLCLNRNICIFNDHIVKKNVKFWKFMYTQKLLLREEWWT